MRYKHKNNKKGAKKKGKAKNFNHSGGTVLGGATTYRTIDADYDNYSAARREEQAAYDDYLASLDMADK